MGDWPQVPRVGPNTVMVIVVDRVERPEAGERGYAVLFYQQHNDPDVVDLTLRALYDQLNQMFDPKKKGN